MAPDFKAPGVFIEEISKFPPSVAQVETAIPAFVGYTQKAIVRGIDQYAAEKPPCHPIVYRITSLLEYEQFLGGSELATDIEVIAKGRNEVIATVGTSSKHVMYYSLQGFFANGEAPATSSLWVKRLLVKV